MTSREYVLRVHEYYGLQYNRVMAEEVLLYLRGMSGERIQELYDQVLLMHSAKYRALPDVAVMAEATAEMCDREDALTKNLPPYPKYLLPAGTVVPRGQAVEMAEEDKVDREEARAAIRAVTARLLEGATPEPKTKKYPD